MPWHLLKTLQGIRFATNQSTHYVVPTAQQERLAERKQVNHTHYSVSAMVPRKWEAPYGYPYKFICRMPPTLNQRVSK